GRLQCFANCFPLRRAATVGEHMARGLKRALHRESFAESCSISEDRRPTLLWIDDFEPALELYKATMEKDGFEVVTASNGAAALGLFMMNRVDLVITDYEMPEINGEAVATMIKAIDPRVPVILFSGSTLTSPRCLHLADAVCDKAGQRRELLAAIHRLLEK